MRTRPTRSRRLAACAALAFALASAACAAQPIRGHSVQDWLGGAAPADLAQATERPRPPKASPDERQAQIAIEGCKRWSASIWQTSARQPVGLEFPVARLAPESEWRSGEFKAQVRMVARFADGQEQTIRQTCSFLPRPGSRAELSGASAGPADDF